MKIKGQIVIEKNCQLVIDLIDDDAEEYDFKEGTVVTIESDKIKRFEE